MVKRKQVKYLKKYIMWSLGILLGITSVIAQSQSIMIANFTQGELLNWEEKSFSGSTEYQLKSIKGMTALSAKSRNAASGLFKEIEINLQQTPYLNWQWLAENRLNGIEETRKEGDDYVARIYVVAKHPLFFWKTRALNYVWSSNQKAGKHWENAYTAQAMMIAVDDEFSPLNQWQSRKRNVAEDFKDFFGENVEKVDVIAIMTDTDNSQRDAIAWYGDINFSAE